MSATVSIATRVVIVTFDQALTPGTDSNLAWTAFADLGAGRLQLVPTGPLVVAGATVTYTTVPVAALPGLDTIQYAAPPGTVTGLVGGLPALSFGPSLLGVIP